jgi:hypothetical protein
MPLGAQRHNLPAQPTALIGREREISTLGKLLRRKNLHHPVKPLLKQYGTQEAVCFR